MMPRDVLLALALEFIAVFAAGLLAITLSPDRAGFGGKSIDALLAASRPTPPGTPVS